MPGSVLGVGVLACAAALTVGLATAGAAAVCAQRTEGAADAAALAAADAAAGAVIGTPCELAGLVAEASGASVRTCDVEGLIATVTVSAPFGMLTAVASARAGPPPPETTSVGG